MLRLTPVEHASAAIGGPRERRRFRRSALSQRVRIAAEGLEGSADLIDGSAGGLFLRVDGPRRPAAGHVLEVGFDAGTHGGPARTAQRRRARVIRCLSHGSTHYVALRFHTPDALRISAARLG